MFTEALKVVKVQLKDLVAAKRAEFKAFVAAKKERMFEEPEIVANVCQMEIVSQEPVVQVVAQPVTQAAVFEVVSQEIVAEPQVEVVVQTVTQAAVFEVVSQEIVQEESGEIVSQEPVVIEDLSEDAVCAVMKPGQISE
jgi:hypothetical protein